MRLYVLPLLLIAFLGCNQQTTKQDKKWKLIWSDEFDRAGPPNDQNWSFSGQNKADWACYCTDRIENAYVADGYLHVKGTVEQLPDGTMNYQTGCIQTKGKFSFLYGKIEVFAKLQHGKGSWPAIWMMPENSEYGGWPKSGEIDIMEHLNSDAYVYQTIHSEFLDNQGGKDSVSYYVTAPYNVGEFNVFACEWYPDSLCFSINDKATFTYPRGEGDDSKKWPFDKPFYIILNQALGGNWVGEINPEDIPQEMLVDWVRVYQ